MGHKCPEKSGLTTLEHFLSTKGHARIKVSYSWIALIHPQSQTLSKEIYSKMDTSTKTSCLSWYIAAECKKCRSGSESQNWIYFSTILQSL